MNNHTEPCLDRIAIFGGTNVETLDIEIDTWLSEDNVIDRVKSMQHTVTYNPNVKQMYHTVAILYSLDGQEE